MLTKDDLRYLIGRLPERPRYDADKRMKAKLLTLYNSIEAHASAEVLVIRNERGHAFFQAYLPNLFLANDLLETVLLMQEDQNLNSITIIIPKKFR